MNYFGLFFSFMLPGMIIGIMMMASARQTAERKQAAARRARAAQMRAVPKNRLYVCDIREERKAA